MVGIFFNMTVSVKSPKELKEKDLRSWIILNSIPGVGSSLFQKLISIFGSPESVLSAKYSELCSVKSLNLSLNADLARCIVDRRCLVDADLELELAKKHGCRLITFDDAEYPANLRSTPDPPPILYVKGKLLEVDSVAISIIGSRNSTTYGKAACEFFSRQLTTLGVTIVSGMAKGIDTIAHKSALEANGRTIAVLGNGLSRAYPPENEKLMEQIAFSGAVISEFPMATKPMPDNFPRRNRLISGLALGVLVIEASERSGSLITVSHALNQGREVFALPGEIFSKNAKGTNYLIKQGAKLIDSVEDILEELKAIKPFSNPDVIAKMSQGPGPESSQEEATKQFDPDPSVLAALSDDEIIILRFLTEEPERIHIDLICRQCGLPVSRASAALSSLELKGFVKQSPGKLFAKR
jgi:DNA processing protein